MTDNKLLLFKSHLCSRGLDDDAIREIADAADLVKIETGENLHRANEPLESVFFIVHGRLKQVVVDIDGNQLMQRFLSRGSQFGALGAAQSDIIPVDVIALEPSMALKLDFETVLRLTREHEVFGRNFVQSISRMVSEVLHSNRQQKKASIVTVFHDSPESRPLTGRIIGRLKELGESPCVMGDSADFESVEDIVFRSLIQNGQVLSREDFRRQINEWTDKGRILIDVDASIDPVHGALLVEFSEQVIWCVAENDVDRTVYRLKAIEARAPGWRDKINLVWLLDPDSGNVPNVEKTLDLARRDFKISLNPARTSKLGRQLTDGLERLIHQLRGVRIGLALGGGGARGMAHIGVLKALEENGIVVDMIAGTSAGAMTGIVHAFGYAPDWAKQQFADDLTPGWFFRKIPRGKDWYLFYKYRRRQFDQMLRKYLGDATLEQLPIPIHSVTVDLVEGKPVVRKRGDAVKCILESINLPVISRPICRDGQALVDGGLVNNVPADVLIKNGCNFVIASSVTAHLEAVFANIRPDAPTGAMKSPSTLQTILRSYLVQSVNMNSVGVQPADLVIEPDVTEFELTDFSKTLELANRGEQATLERVSKIRSLLSHLDSQLFPVND